MQSRICPWPWSTIQYKCLTALLKSQVNRPRMVGVGFIFVYASHQTGLVTRLFCCGGLERGRSGTSHRSPAGHPAEVGGHATSNLSLTLKHHPARNPEGFVKKPGALITNGLRGLVLVADCCVNIEVTGCFFMVWGNENSVLLRTWSSSFEYK